MRQDLAAMYVHLDPQAQFVIRMLETKIAYVVNLRAIMYQQFAPNCTSSLHRKCASDLQPKCTTPSW